MPTVPKNVFIQHQKGNNNPVQGGRIFHSRPTTKIRTIPARIPVISSEAVTVTETNAGVWAGSATVTFTSKVDGDTINHSITNIVVPTNESLADLVETLNKKLAHIFELEVKGTAVEVKRTFVENLDAVVVTLT